MLDIGAWYDKLIKFSRVKIENSDKVVVGLRAHQPDRWIMGLCGILLAIGLVVIYAISPALGLTAGTNGSYYVDRQILAIVLAIVGFGITANIPLNKWRESYRLLVGFALFATLVAVVLPVNPNYPAHRWVRIGSMSFESVDFLIFALLIWLAHFLARSMRTGAIKNFKKVALPLLAVLVGIGFLIAGVQSDLGSTGVIVAMMAIMAFVAGLSFKRILIIGVVVIIGTFLAIASTPYRLARIETFLHPNTNCLTTGYQSCQAIIAVGSGGFLGIGVGRSVQAYGYLPESDNDSIFAIYAEKFGFVGSIILLAIFGALFTRMSRIAERAPDNFTRLFVIGVLTWISIEALINIGAMIGLLPLKGITLPFISYGGTSVVFFAAAMGLVYQISRYTTTVPGEFNNPLQTGRAGTNDNISHRRGIRGAYHPDLSDRS